ncbi:SRPBCC family protein [Arcticibacter sp. MXS-1]|uniref:SRPBCC family protein n=1 Tax=Arcticibacter sp. MXS-1 TaxID=3341726 RepID=UPI0035A84990
MAIVYPRLREAGKTKPVHHSRKESVNIDPAERIFSVAGGAYLIYAGLSQILKKPFTGVSKAVAGGALLVRGVSGYCPAYAGMKHGKDADSINVKQYFTVNRPRTEVYQFWKKLENLPLFMRHVEKVEQKGENLWHWKAKFSESLPAISWNAEIVKEKEDHFIGWRSVEGSIIDNAGKVEFNDAPGGQGTEVQVVVTYRAPAGVVGSGIARLLNPFVENMIREDVRNFKQYIETGEIPTIEGQPSGRS